MHRADPIARRWWVPVVLAAFVLGCAPDHPPRDPDALTLILPRDADDLDPRFVRDPYGLKVSRLLFASLVTIDPRTLAVTLDLAEAVDASTDGLRYAVTLRPGLRFSDGSALTAEDVVATYEGIVDPALQSRYAGTYERIASVTAHSPREVVFVLDAPHATFLTDLEMPIVRAEDATTRLDPERAMPVGAGPYQLRAREPGRMTLDANPHWHGGTPTHARLEVVVVRDDNTRALRLLAGAGDVAINAVPPLLVPLFEADETFEVRSAPGVGTTYLGFHTETIPLPVREAIAHAIDRASLVEHKLGGRAVLSESWIPEGHWASIRQDARAFDLERARELLDEAGWVPDAEGIRRRLLLRVSSDRFRVSMSRAIAAMLREVGLEVVVRPSEGATLIADLNAGRFEICFLQVPEVFEPHVLNWFFSSTHIPENGQLGANRWRLRDDVLDRALESGRVAASRDQRQRAYRIVQGRLHAALPVLPLWQEETIAVVRRGVDFDVPRDGRFGTLAR
ncbi:MAG: ABC transporter substrate-binding protein [Myxococcota bacterium]